VISAWGGAADWDRNLRATPPVAVRISGDRYLPETRLLDGAERLELLRWVRRHHPIEAGLARPILDWGLDGSEAELAELATRLRAVAFRPRAERPTRSASSATPSHTSEHTSAHSRAAKLPLPTYSAARRWRRTTAASRS
jgi:hypothetical protein